MRTIAVATKIPRMHQNRFDLFVRVTSFMKSSASIKTDSRRKDADADRAYLPFSKIRTCENLFINKLKSFGHVSLSICNIRIVFVHDGQSFCIRSSMTFTSNLSLKKRMTSSKRTGEGFVRVGVKYECLTTMSMSFLFIFVH
jgi:hypothetical protein